MPKDMFQEAYPAIYRKSTSAPLAVKGATRAIAWTYMKIISIPVIRQVFVDMEDTRALF